MASAPIMSNPICLVENKKEKLSVNPIALKFLREISEPVVVVAIVGLYRTGKSYLMNCLAGQRLGFALGSTIQSETKGIWMWCVPHPYKQNRKLVLLDTEGLGDVEKGDPKNDSWIFALAVLLSSCLVYNSMNTINNDALEKLHYVTELTELIRSKSSPGAEDVEESTEFLRIFPDFIWTIRDFTLELKIDDRNISADEYLEKALKLTAGKSDRAQLSNRPRECIRHFFPNRKCFVFDRPVQDTALLAHIEDVSKSQLDPKFLKQSNKFRSYIFTHARTKSLRKGVKITGRRLETLVVTYVDTINSGAIPCLENAVTTLAQLENSAALQKAANHYSKQMAQRVRFPTDTLQELLDVHAACEREAIAIFMEHSFKDDEQEYQTRLMKVIKKKEEDFLQQNEEASGKYCQKLLEELSEDLEKSILARTFHAPGGHKLYREAMERIERDYLRRPGKGVKAKEVLQDFLKSQAPIEKYILQADRALTAGQKAFAEERARMEAAEEEQEWLKEQQEEQQQQAQAQLRDLRENIAQLKEKLERERENDLRELKMILEHKLKMQEDMLTEGFKKKSEEMNAEIIRLRKEIEKNKEEQDSPWISRAFDILGNPQSAALAAKVMDLGLKAMGNLV